MHQQKQTGPRYSRDGHQIRVKTDKEMLMVVVYETAPSQQLCRLISVDFGECAGMKILEQVIDAMIEGSDHNALKKTLVELSFADHPDMVERRKERKTMLDETAPATPPPKPEPKLELRADVVVECPATPRLEELCPIVRQRLAPDGMVDMSDTAAQFSRLEQRTRVLVLEIKMPIPSSQSPLTTEQDFETPRPTIHISGPLVQSSHRAFL